MRKKEAKKSTPVLMILVLITAVMPLSLNVLGFNLNLTQAAGSIFSTWGRAVSFVGCAYQPTLMAELVAFTGEIPCQDSTRQEAIAPAADQLASNQEQITMDEVVSAEPVAAPELTLQEVASVRLNILPVTRAKRFAPKCTEKPVGSRQIEDVVALALAEEVESPEPVATRNYKGASFEMNFITKPVFSTYQANEFVHQVKASLSTAAKTGLYQEREARQRQAERIRVLTENCNFKALRAWQEAEAMKPVRVVLKAPSKTPAHAVEAPDAPEPDFSEF